MGNSRSRQVNFSLFSSTVHVSSLLSAQLTSQVATLEYWQRHCVFLWSRAQEVEAWRRGVTCVSEWRGTVCGDRRTNVAGNTEEGR